MHQDFRQLSWRCFCGCLLLLWLSACSQTRPPAQYHRLIAAGLPAIELTETPFYPQLQYQCGPAALATVLQSSGVVSAEPELLAEQVYLPKRQGSLQAELMAASRRAERVPYPLSPELEALVTELHAGHPVLVLKNLGLARFPRWHYAVVIGYDPSRQQLLLRSGTEPRQRLSLRRFERSWQLADYWALVVPAAGSLPATAEPGRYLSAVAQVEQQGRLELAALSYTAAQQRWPNDDRVLFALGNIAYQQADFTTAKLHYYRALELAPAEAAYAFNLSWALLRLGKVPEALSMAELSAQLAPEHPRYSQASVLLQRALSD
ncbi:PA2778 family cysteine peptidase [Alkalimonas delamerensis]|uniref:PA2778 family cysteine peptidase n=1 Tax=Alkalimonas delamerensis TaxID=265981 RepID=A0ABT9GRW3_9GAMM|nr:PA2778 family cysteine peptidase [Alkalimonas delamerensis]MDP4529713.1 PA2778 family cysteine peptidase [Alkalimonas delamerensis]